MTISHETLVSEFGAAVTSGNAAIFVGAGLSLSANLPTWEQLLTRLQKQAKVPAMSDLPLVAQYIQQSLPGGREALETDIIRQLGAKARIPAAGHRAIRQLDIDEIWTTNYDTLLEDEISDAHVVINDTDLAARDGKRRRRIIKLHGSVSQAPLGEPLSWLSPPTITRGDYESFEETHTRLWSSLRASFLTRSILFIGYSFNDPNVELLLRLSRSLGKDAPQHYTVMRKPSEPRNARLHDLKVADLIESGINVHEIADFKELDILLSQLVVRTREPKVFVSGDYAGIAGTSEIAMHVGFELVDTQLGVVSLASRPAMNLSYALGDTLITQGRYSSDRITYYFQGSSNPPKPLTRRVGTAVYTSFRIGKTKVFALSKCRAAVFFGGSAGTRTEIRFAQRMNIPLVPLASSGGAAKKLWDDVNAGLTTANVPSTVTDSHNWQLLNHPLPHVSAKACRELLELVTYQKKGQPI